MPKVRQMPRVFLRGSLVNETMRHLTKEQQLKVSILTEDICNHPRMAGHKHEFIYRLGTTIACDYRDDADAHQEFRIAIWRGVVQLLYHCDYEFQCNNCGATEYTTAKGKPTKINRRMEYCPVCGCCRVTDPGGSLLFAGQAVKITELRDINEALLTSESARVTFESTIVSVRGKPKYSDPDTVLNDPDQLYKFFGTWVWNYFRQVLLENKITKNTTTQQIVGPADITITRAIASALKKTGIAHSYCEADNPNNGGYNISCSMLESPFKYTDDFICAFSDSINIGSPACDDGSPKYFSQCEFQPLKVVINFLEHSIVVNDLGGRATVIAASISSSENVTVVGNTVNDDGDSYDAVQQLEQPTMSATLTPDLEQQDRLCTLRKSLPDDTVAVFDILTGGFAGGAEVYERFSQSCSTDKELPPQSQIAKFLRISSKEMKKHKEIIKAKMLAMGFITSEPQHNTQLAAV